MEVSVTLWSLEEVCRPVSVDDFLANEETIQAALLEECGDGVANLQSCRSSLRLRRMKACGAAQRLALDIAPPSLGAIFTCVVKGSLR
jgi:hypothetical protein